MTYHRRDPYSLELTPELAEYFQPELAEYFEQASMMGGFHATPTLDLGEELTAREMQIYLNELGYKGKAGKALAEDNVWKAADTESMGRLQTATYRQQGKNVSAEPIEGSSSRLLVFPSSFASQVRSRLALTPRAKQPMPGGQAQAANQVTATVVSLQKELNRRSFKGKNGKALTEDGLYGQNTVFAFQAFAKKNGVPQVISQVDKKTAKIDLGAYQKLLNTTAAPQPAPQPAQKPAQGQKAPATTANQAVPVKDVQALLVRLGEPSTKDMTDGLWGKKTEAAWKKRAQGQKLDPAITRLGPQTANVVTATLERLRALAGGGAAPKPVAQPGTSGKGKVSVADVQRIVVALGEPATKDMTDGLWGKKTQAAWQKQAKARKLDASIEKIDGKNARVSEATFQALNQAAKATPPKAVLVPIQVKDVQRLVVALGQPKTKDLSDGLWGVKTQAAWSTEAQKRGLDPTIQKVDKDTARVAETTQKALEAAAKGTKPVQPAKPTDDKKAAPKPALALQNVAVKDIQRVVVALGAPKTKNLSDGLWGNDTAKAWKDAASRRGLSGQIEKVDGKTARVLQVEYKALNDATKKPEPKKADAKKAEPKPKPVVTDQGTKVMVDVSRGVIPTAVNRLRGVSALTEKSADKDLAKAWGEEAKKRKLDPAITFQKDQARVEATTAKVLATEAQKKPAPIPAGLVDVMLTTVQKALNAQAGKAAVDVSGKWDAKTEAGTLKMLGTTKDKLTPRLTAKKNALRLEPELARKIGELAKSWDQMEKDRKALEAQRAQLVTVRVDELQRALNAFKGFSDESAVPITGSWDAKTKAAYIAFAKVPQNAEAAVDKLVLADKKSIQLSPNASKTVEGLATKWETAQAERAAQESGQKAAETAQKTATTAEQTQSAAQEAATTAKDVNTPAQKVQEGEPFYVTGQGPATEQQPAQQPGQPAQQPVQQQQQTDVSPQYSNVINFPGGGGAAPAVVTEAPLPPPGGESPPALPPAPAPTDTPVPAPAAGLSPMVWVAVAGVLGLAFWWFTQDSTKALPADAA